MSAAPLLLLVDTNATRIANERMSQRLVTAFVFSGILFMLLPGTFLGIWNLLSISQAHDVGTLPRAWLQAHGQAQLFGWIGSFILGIGFYSLPKMQGTDDQTHLGMFLGLGGISLVVLSWVVAHYVWWRHPRGLHHVLKFVAYPMQLLTLNRLVPQEKYSEKDISPYLWPNGKMPVSDDWTSVEWVILRPACRQKHAMRP